MIDEDVHQRVKPQKLRAMFAEYRDGSAGRAPKATKAREEAPGSEPKKPPKKTAKAEPRAEAGAGRKERVVAR